MPRMRIIRAVLCAGMYPNVVQVKLPEKKYNETMAGSFAATAKAKEIRFFERCDTHDAAALEQERSRRAAYETAEQKALLSHLRAKPGWVETTRVFMHPSSVCFKSRHYRYPYLVYNTKVSPFVRSSVRLSVAVVRPTAPQPCSQRHSKHCHHCHRRQQ